MGQWLTQREEMVPKPPSLTRGLSHLEPGFTEASAAEATVAGILTTGPQQDYAALFRKTPKKEVTCPKLQVTEKLPGPSLSKLRALSFCHTAPPWLASVLIFLAIKTNLKGLEKAVFVL